MKKTINDNFTLITKTFCRGRNAGATTKNFYNASLFNTHDNFTTFCNQISLDRSHIIACISF